jgi:CheY-like chemotaxis protein
MNWGNEIPKSALVVVEDTMASSAIAKFLNNNRVESVKVESDSSDAWGLVQSNKFDVIFMGWKMKPMSGPAFFNRVRGQQRYATTPILVITKEVNQEAFKLLEDFPCSGFTQATDISTIQRELFRIWEEKIWYEKNIDQVDLIFKKVKENPTEIEIQLKFLMQNSPNPVPMALVIAAEFVKNGYLRRAQILYKDILAREENCLQALSGIGKALILEGRTDEATVYLRVAWRLCHQNIDRLCMLGELELSNHDTSAARDYFNKVLEVDRNDRRGQAGLVVCTNFEDYVKSNAGANLPRNFASICNTIAIALIKERKFKKGIEQYSCALNLLKKADVKSKVMFNMGMAFLRAKDLESSLLWFGKAKQHGGRGFSKPREYIAKINSGEFTKASPDTEPGTSVFDSVDEYVEMDIDEFGELSPSQVSGDDDEHTDWFEEDEL